MARTKQLLAGVALMAAAVWIYIASPGVVLTLVANGQTQVWTSVGGQGSLLKTLVPGTRLPILRCVDSKSFFDYQVQLSDGRLGYVGFGAPVEMHKPFYVFWPVDPVDTCH